MLRRIATHADVQGTPAAVRKTRNRRESQGSPMLSLTTMQLTASDMAAGETFAGNPNRNARVWKEWSYEYEHPEPEGGVALNSPVKFTSFSDPKDMAQLRESCRHGSLAAKDRRATWLSLLQVDLQAAAYHRTVGEYKQHLASLASCPGCADLHLDHLHRFGAPFLTSSSLWREGLLDKHALSTAGETAAKRVLFAVHARFRSQVEYFPQVPDLVCVLLTYLSEEETWAAVCVILAARPGNRWLKQGDGSSSSGSGSSGSSSSSGGGGGGGGGGGSACSGGGAGQDGDGSSSIRAHLFPMSRFEGRVFVATFLDIVKERQPVVHRHLAEFCRSPDELSATFLRWFERFFVGVLPMRYVTRILDSLFVEGAKILYRVGLTLLAESRAHIVEVCATRKKGQQSLGEMLEECFAHLGFFPDSRDAASHPVRASLRAKATAKKWAAKVRAAAAERKRSGSTDTGVARRDKLVKAFINKVRRRTESDDSPRSSAAATGPFARRDSAAPTSAAPAPGGGHRLSVSNTSPPSFPPPAEPRKPNMVLKSKLSNFSRGLARLGFGARRHSSSPPKSSAGSPKAGTGRRRGSLFFGGRVRRAKSADADAERQQPPVLAEQQQGKQAAIAGPPRMYRARSEGDEPAADAPAAENGQPSGQVKPKVNRRAVLREQAQSMRASKLKNLFDISEQEPSQQLQGTTVVHPVDPAGDMMSLSLGLDLDLDRKSSRALLQTSKSEAPLNKNSKQGGQDRAGAEEEVEEEETKDGDEDEFADLAQVEVDTNFDDEEGSDPVMSPPSTLKVCGDDADQMSLGSVSCHDERVPSDELTIGRRSSRRRASLGFGGHLGVLGAPSLDPSTMDSSQDDELNNNVIMVQNLIGGKRFYSESSMVRCSSAAGATILQHLAGESQHCNMYKDGEAMDHFDFKVFLSEAFAWRMSRRWIMRKDEANRKSKAVTRATTVATFGAIGHYSARLLRESCTVRRSESATRLVSWLPERVRFRAGNIDVLYSTQRDGRSLSSLYTATDQPGYCGYVLVITCLKPDGTEGTTIGGYSSAAFVHQRSNRPVGDETCFLFRLSPAGGAAMWPFAGVIDHRAAMDKRRGHGRGSAASGAPLGPPPSPRNSVGAQSGPVTTPRRRLRTISLAASSQNSQNSDSVETSSYTALTEDEHAIEDQVEQETRISFLQCHSKWLKFGTTSEAYYDKNGKRIDPEDIHNLSDEALGKMGLVQRLAGPGLWMNSGLTEGHTGWCNTYQNDPLCTPEDAIPDMSNAVHRYFRIAEVEVLGIKR